jgi:hypothetical protein
MTTAARQVFIIALVLLDLTILIVYTFVNPTDETETSFSANSEIESNQVRVRLAPPPITVDHNAIHALGIAFRVLGAAAPPGCGLSDVAQGGKIDTACGVHRAMMAVLAHHRTCRACVARI